MGEGNDISNNDLHIANINPYRYKGYYYDKETELYYLNERYYNPKWGRFINSDSYGGQIGGNILYHNIYAYTLNDPINNYDEDGTFAITLGGIGAAALTAVGNAAIALAKGAIAFGVGLLIGKAVSSKVKSTPKKKVKTKTKTAVNVKAKTQTSINYLSRTPNKPCAPASNKTGTVIPTGEPFTIFDAQQYINNKKTKARDVVCINKASAQAVAIGVNKEEYYEEKAHINAPGYFNHFHDTHKFNHAHIWYYLD